jgi:hypothetical protein
MYELHLRHTLTSYVYLIGNGTALANQPWFQIPRSLRTKPCTDTKVPKAPRPSFQKFMRLLKYPPHLIVSFNGALQFAGLYGMYVTLGYEVGALLLRKQSDAVSLH